MTSVIRAAAPDACAPLHPRGGRSQRRPRAIPAQRGAAVLMALFIATLATLIVSGLFWQQFVLLRTIENQQLLVQSRVLMAGALDWARAMLREDSLRSSHDGLDEFWAQGLAETRLDQLGESSTLASQASISGSIEDAQSKLNLRNLVGADGEIDAAQLEALKRLCDLLGVPVVTAELLALRIKEAFAPDAASDSAGGPKEDEARPLPPLLGTDVAGVRGIEPEAGARLAPYVVLLDTITPVNVNTASPEVIAARIGISLAQGRALVADRDRVTYFANTGDVRNRLGGAGVDATDRDIATVTRYFFVRGQIKLARADIRMEALVRRAAQGQPGPVEVLWQREL
jgi:general secretion pathway protein K